MKPENTHASQKGGKGPLTREKLVDIGGAKAGEGKGNAWGLYSI